MTLLLLLLQLSVTLGVTSPAPGLAHLPSIRLPASQPACLQVSVLCHCRLLAQGPTLRRTVR